MTTAPTRSQRIALADTPDGWRLAADHPEHDWAHHIDHHAPAGRPDDCPWCELEDI